MRLKIYLRTLAGLILLLSFLTPATAQINSRTVSDIQLLLQEKASRSPAQRKMDSRLLQAVREKRGQKMVEGVNLEPAKINAERDGRVKVDISAEVSDELINKIKAAGGQIIFPSKEYHSVRALINLSNAETIAGFSEVRFIQPAALYRTVGTGKDGRLKSDHLKPLLANSVKSAVGQPMRRLSPAERTKRVQDALQKYLKERKDYNPLVLNSGSTNSQGDHSHRADDARNHFGYAGQGIKIGVLSDSYNALGGAAADVLTDDLPGAGNPFGNTTPVTVVADYSGGEDEGRAMLQIVHDIAPKAQLYFATGDISEASFAANIVALRSTYGCDIIIDDLGYYDEPTFQDGIVAQAVNTVTAAGALYFSSAGNEGSVELGTGGVWEGDFNDVGSPVFTSGSKAGTIHNFGSTPANGDSILAVASGVYNLQWSDPWGASTNDYDLFLISSTGAVKASSTTVQSGTQNPYEQFAPPTLVAGDRLVVFKAASAAIRAINLNTNRGTLKVATTGQTHGHSAAVDAYSVAAIPASGIPFTSTNSVETFTSDGLRRIFYNATGTPITPGNYLFSTNGGTVRNKPDITAADGVSTTLPSSTGLNPFYGTSAAAPHAAAIAALIKSANPALTPSQIRSILTSTALDIQTPGYDNISGYGVVQAYQAMQSVNPAPLPYINPGTTTFSEGSFSNNNGSIDPGELGNLLIQLNNSSLANATNVTVTVTTTTPGVTIVQGTSTYGTINSSSSATNTGRPIVFAVNSSVSCSTNITFLVKVTFDGGVGSVGFTASTTTGSTNTIANISSTLGATPPGGTGYTVVSGQQTGRLTRGSVASTCAVPVANPGLTATTGLRQFDAYTFTNTTSASQCYTVTLTSSNGANIYTAAYSSGGFIPSNPSTNYLAEPGQSATTQVYSFTVAAGSAFTVVVHDVNVTPASNSPYNLTVTYVGCTAAPSCNPITISPATLPNGATGVPYNQPLTTTGGSGSGYYTYSFTGNLPAGLTFSGNTLSGTPTQAGTFTFNLTAIDPVGCSASKSFTFTIAGITPNSVTATTGTPQATHVCTTFPIALQATVKDSANNPLAGVNVTFTAPITGATGTFAGASSATVVTNASGVAIAPNFTANSTPGSYTVTATVNGVVTTANFALTNTLFIVTSNADSGPGTLREAVDSSCPGSIITFGAGVNQINLTTGELLINKPLTITGPGASMLTVSGSNLSRIFNITAGTSTVNISGLTVRDGKPQAGILTTNSQNGGGGILLFSGVLNLTNCVVTNNDASLTDFAEGGGIDAESGAGLVTISGCSIINNKAQEDGGGVAHWGGGRMTISNSTISGNTATGGGGTNGDGIGGGIFSYYLLTLTNSTVYNNTGYVGGGNIYRYASTITMSNTIVGGGSLSNTAATTAKDISGSISSSGYNIIQNTGGYTISGTTTGNQLGVNPRLFPLANYGGTVPTHLPMSNSPAINASNPSLTTGTDQRGSSRYIGGRADIGSVETNYTSTVTGGASQTTFVNTPFILPLQATVLESGNLVTGDTVVFIAPTAGAGGTFTNLLNKDTAVTNLLGVATSHTFIANGTAGTYSDTARIGTALPDLLFGLTNAVALPLTFGSVTASASNCTVRIDWKTLSESETKDFTVEFSPDGITFSPLATISAAGNSTIMQSYSYSHVATIDGMNYYRIKQSDKNGVFTYSNVVSVANSCGKQPIVAYPNPVKDKLTVILPVTGKYSLTVFDIAGRKITQQMVSGGTREINAATWIKGVYTLSIIKEGEPAYLLKIIKQ